MKIKGLLIIICCLFGLGCTTSKDTIAYAENSKALEELINKKSFRISLDWAYPLGTSSIYDIANAGLLPPGSNVGAISLIGNDNYMEMQGDSISMYLPFFGERRLFGNYNSNDIGIQFQGKPKKLSIEKNDRKQVYEIRFSATTDNDTHFVFIRVKPNLSTKITINSMARTTISYQGAISKFPIAEKDL